MVARAEEPPTYDGRVGGSTLTLIPFETWCCGHNYDLLCIVHKRCKRLLGLDTRGAHPLEFWPWPSWGGVGDSRTVSWPTPGQGLNPRSPLPTHPWLLGSWQNWVVAQCVGLPIRLPQGAWRCPGPLSPQATLSPGPPLQGCYQPELVLGAECGVRPAGPPLPSALRR